MLDLDGTSSGNLISGVISNATTASVNFEDTRLTKSNASVWILAASNTYVGVTLISGGTLQYGTGASGEDGSINYTNSVTNNAALVYDLAGIQTASYLIQGSGSLTKLGSGMLTLAASATIAIPAARPSAAVRSSWQLGGPGHRRRGGQRRRAGPEQLRHQHPHAERRHGRHDHR